MMATNPYIPQAPSLQQQFKPSQPSQGGFSSINPTVAKTPSKPTPSHHHNNSQVPISSIDPQSSSSQLVTTGTPTTTISSGENKMPTLKNYDPNRNMGFFERTGNVLSQYNPFSSNNVYLNTGQALTGTGNYQAPLINAPSAFLAPFQIYSRTQKGDEVIRGVQSRATMTYDTSLNGISGKPFMLTPTQTFSQKEQSQIQSNPDLAKPTEQFIYETGIKTQNRVNSEFSKKVNERNLYYQGKIDTGELTIDQATSQYDVDVSNIKKEADLKIQTVNESTVNDIIGPHQQFKQEIAKSQEFKYNIPSIVTTGALIGGSFIAPVTTGTALFLGGFATGTEQITQKNYLEAGLSIGFGSLGLSTANIAIGNQITKAQIEGAINARTITFDKRLVGENFILDFTESLGKTATAKYTGESLTKSTLIEGSETKFNIFGKSQGRVLTYDYNTGKSLAVGFSQKTIGTGEILPKGFDGGITPSTSILYSTELSKYSVLGNDAIGKPLSGISGTGKLFPADTGKVTKTLYGGVTKQYGDNENILLSVSGKARASYTINTGKGITAISNVNIGFLPKDFSVIKIIKTGDSGLDNIGISGSGTIIKTGFSPISKTVSVNKLGINQIERGLLEVGTKTTSQTIGKSILAGTGGLSKMFTSKNISNVKSSKSLNTNLQYSGLSYKNTNASVVKTNNILYNSNRHLTGLKQVPITETSLISKPISVLTPTQINPPINRPQQQITPPNTGYFNFVLPPFWPPVGTFGFGSSIGGYSKRKKQPVRYGFSVRAAFQGIKATKIPKFAFTGIGIRPIISRRNKRK